MNFIYRMKIGQNMFSTRIKIGPKNRVDSITMKIWRTTRMYCIRIKISPQFRVFSIKIQEACGLRWPKTRAGFGVEIVCAEVLGVCEGFTFILFFQWSYVNYRKDLVHWSLRFLYATS